MAKKNSHKYPLFFLLGVAILGVVLIRLFFVNKSAGGKGAVHEIVLGPAGFRPTFLSIRQGDTVRFKSQLNNPFWPASNDHPTHKKYPGFDPKRPIAADQTWSFTFDKQGRFDYHDHLSPSNLGTIVSMSADQKASSALQDCSKKGLESYQCGLKQLRETVRKEGISGGFNFFSNPQAVDSSNCHGLAHEFGKIVYNQTAANSPLPLTNNTSFCEYGFWHGFLNAFIEHDKKSNIKNVSNLCLKMDAQDESPGKMVGWNCWHGLGLGAVGDPPKMITWGDTQKMAESGFPLCEKVSKDKRQTSACVEGIFHSMITYMMLKQYKLSFRQEDPLALCRVQKKYQHQCYAQLAPQTSGFVFSSLINDPNLLSGLNPEDRDLYVRSASVARIRSQFANPNYIDRFIGDCHAMPKEVQDSCLNAGVIGIFIKGTVEEYRPSLKFCSSNSLSHAEKLDCYSALGQTLRMNYPADKLSQICSSVDKAYTDYCLGKSYR